jgi:hemoglobin
LTPDPVLTQEICMSIYDDIGGPDAVAAAVEGFYRRLLEDPATAHFFAATDLAHLKSHQRAFIAAAIGGPEIYAGRDMSAAHSGLDIADADFDRVVGHLVETLTSLGVPGDTIATIGGTLAPLRTDIVSAHN